VCVCVCVYYNIIELSDLRRILSLSEIGNY